MMIELYTIGFTKKNAEKFFNLLTSNGVNEIVDTRINNTSQLAGFAKADDLKFIAKSVGNIGYSHHIDFAPTKELLTKYRKGGLSWEDYEVEYLNLLDMRHIAQKVNIGKLHKNCFLCSEHAPEKCHRRLLAEYLQHVKNDIKIFHLK